MNLLKNLNYQDIKTRQRLVLVPMTGALASFLGNTVFVDYTHEWTTWLTFSYLVCFFVMTLGMVLIMKSDDEYLEKMLNFTLQNEGLSGN